jgi:predicted  nucleic acid-binding Zn-ribbon protein
MEQLLREVDHVRELLDAKIIGLREFTEERFESVSQHLAMIERQRVEQKRDTATSLDAALRAQKEASSKAEAATTKSIDQLADTFNTAFEGVRRELADLKERVGKIA